MRTLIQTLIFLIALLPLPTHADELKVGDPAPLFSLKNQDGVTFSLADRKHKGWTVLFFYP